MDPVTTTILASAAEKFAIEFAGAFGGALGSELGNALGDKLFGSHSGDEINSKLDLLFAQMKQLEKKLDFLIERFPKVILQIVEQDSADVAYSFLWATRTMLAGMPENPPEATENFAVSLRANWYIWIAKEHRTSTLLEIPMWTELVRTRLGTQADSHLVPILKKKFDAIDNYKKELEVNHTDCIVEARNILSLAYFSETEVRSDPPYLRWQKSSPLIVKICDLVPVGHAKEDHLKCVYIPDQGWLDDQENYAARLETLRENIELLSKKLETITPLFELLKGYIAEIENLKNTWTATTIATDEALPPDDGPLWLLDLLHKPRAALSGGIAI